MFKTVLCGTVVFFLFMCFFHRAFNNYKLLRCFPEMKIYFVLMFLLCGGCVSFPQCCHRSYNYGDFLFLLKCGFSLCPTSQKFLGNICISCIPKIPAVNQNSSSTFDVPKISKPEKLCQGLDATNGRDSGRIVLKWVWLEVIQSPSLFMIEARNDSTLEHDWAVVGLTNETFVEVTHIDLQLRHQFRVRPITSANVTLLPVISDWLMLPDLNTSLSPPSNVRIAEYFARDGFVDARVEWTASRESPCSYKLFWLPAIGGDYFEQKTVFLPDDGLSATLEGLLFEWNYTVTITPHNPGAVQKVRSADVWFMTPTCLNVTGANFSICAPGPPLNVCAERRATETVVTWMPPEHTSAKNPVSGYQVYAVKSRKMKYSKHLLVGKDTLNASFRNLDSSTLYHFEVRAISEGGTGKPSIAQMRFRELSVTSMASPSVPYLYIASCLVIPLIVTVSVILFRQCQRTTKYKGCSSETVKAYDHLQPFRVLKDKIQLQEVVGRGAFGTVHRGLYARNGSKEDAEEVAVKVFPSEGDTRLHLLYEVELMCIIGRHDQIVGLHGFTIDSDNLYLILEYCPLGDLHSYLVNLKPELLQMKSLPLPERVSSNTEKERGHGKRLCSYIYQVAKGMEYIASLKLIHRDVAARNILMQSESRVKIADFGLLQDVYETRVYSGNAQKKLPIKWMAPEALEKQRFSTYTDVWSFGVFMWEVFKLGKEPYPGIPCSQMLEYLKMGYRLEKPHCSREWYNLMQKCWRENPRERLQFKELVRQIGTIIGRMSLYITVA